MTLDVSGATLSSLYLRKGSNACIQRMPFSPTLIAASTVIIAGANLSSLISRKTSNAWNRTTNHVATVWTCSLRIFALAHCGSTTSPNAFVIALTALQVSSVVMVSTIVDWPSLKSRVPWFLKGAPPAHQDPRSTTIQGTRIQDWQSLRRGQRHARAQTPCGCNS